MQIPIIAGNAFDLIEARERVAHVTSTPRGKSRPICRKLARDIPRIGRTSNLLILVQLIGGKFA